jgi:hypothetical protein
MGDADVQHGREGKRWLGLWAVAVGLVTFLVFSGSLRAGLVDLDDFPLLRDNPAYRGLSPEHLKWMFTTTLMGHYQPLTWVSFAIDHAIAGTDWRWYHFTNVLIHSVNAALVFVLCVRLVAIARKERLRWPELAACAAAALTWSVHPLRVESVAWVTERRDVLSAVFLLGTALAYLQAFAERRFPRRSGEVGDTATRWYAASAGLLLLSLLSKSWGMSFFVVAIVMDVYPLRRLSLRLDRAAWRVLAEKIPYAVLGLAFLVIAGTAQQSAHGAVRSLAEWPIGARVAQAAYGLVFYLWKSVSPTDLSPLYEMPQKMNPFEGRYLTCFAVVALGLAGAWSLRRRAPGVVAAAVAYAVIVAPVLGFFQSGDQFVADRYSYVAMIPWTALLAGGGVCFMSRHRADGKASLAVAAASGAAVAVGVLAWLTVLQVDAWRDRLSLWLHAVSVTPTASVHENLALSLDDAKRPDLAIEEYRAALELRPEGGRAWYSLANLLKRQGDRVGAERAYREAAKYMPQAYMAWVNLGSMIQNERPDDALECFRAAVRDVERPREGSLAGRQLSGLPYVALGHALMKRGAIDEAQPVLTRGLYFEDSKAEAASLLAQIARRGR